MNTLIVQNLNLVYANRHQALKDVNLEIGNGMFGLLGPNGAGKSSLMKTITGLQKPSSGNIFFNGTDIIKNPLAIKKHLGFLPQDFGVYPKVTAYNLLQHIAVLKGVRHAAQRKEQVYHLLEKVNLQEYTSREVHTFSGGMKQRFGVAQALLGNPSIIIVDEPTAGLDPEERNRFNILLSEISEEVIVILSTHLVEDVRNLCSGMAVMNRGEILRTGKPKEMLEHLNGKIYSKKIDRRDLEKYRSGYRLVNSRLVEKELHITVFSEEPLTGFEETEPELEHVYFHSLNENTPAI